MIRKALTAAALATGVLIVAPAHANALPSNGSLLVPGDLAPGNYWATPTVASGGYVAVCSSYTCEVEDGMIDNYDVEGRTMIVVPPNATMVNVDNAELTPV
ncbi:MAG: hypothetical protein PHQ28_17060 [Mycobacterium sp.]|nr:hypothetical protein [Mycobacterium sp.]